MRPFYLRHSHRALHIARAFLNEAPLVIAVRKHDVPFRGADLRYVLRQNPNDMRIGGGRITLDRIFPLYLLLVDVIDDNRPSDMRIRHEQLFVSILNEVLGMMGSVAVLVEEHPELETVILLFQSSTPGAKVEETALFCFLC